MISASDVYWVMQMDSIRAGAGIFCFVLTSLGGLATIYALVEEEFRLLWLGVPALLLAILCGLSEIFLPSSKTAAAMIVLPALTSETVIETVTPEAHELYDLAKQALRNVAQRPEELPAEDKSK